MLIILEINMKTIEKNKINRTIEEDTLTLELFYTEKTTYEITISPNDKSQYFGSPRRIELFTMKVQSILTKALTNNGVEFKLWLELSEPKEINKEAYKKSKSGSRLHYHGTIRFPNEIAVGLFLLKGQYLLSRTMDVYISNKGVKRIEWIPYCRKQRGIIKLLCYTQSKTPHILEHTMSTIKR